MSFPKTAELWKASGAASAIAPRYGDTWVLSELQDYVGGAIEIVHIMGGHMLVNEEGLLKDLPVNVAATTLARKTIVGDVVMSPKGMLV